MKNKVKKIIGGVFNLELDSINDDASPDNIMNWDSLNHMNLIVSLEEEFSIRFSDQEISEMLNFELIIYTIKQKVNLQ
jgi:acyl carrier protein